MRLPVSAAALALVLGSLSAGCASDTGQGAGAGSTAEPGWTQLFNGRDLSGWDVYLGPKMDAKGEKMPGTETGLNNDPENVFTVAEQDGGPVIRISGVIGGGISTVRSFGNYHLRMQMKWGPGNPWNRTRADSGLLYHAGGGHGLDAGFWMRSFEFQVMPDAHGDFIPILGCVADVPTATADGGTRYHYQPDGEHRTFTRVTELQRTGDRVDRLPSFKDPASDWLTLEVYTVGQTAVHLVDGQVVMVLHNTRLHESGATTPLTSGKIELQSEGSEVFYRNLELRPITALPAGLIDGTPAL
jgi:hypothetical protein